MAVGNVTSAQLIQVGPKLAHQGLARCGGRAGGAAEGTEGTASGAVEGTTGLAA